MEFRGSFQELQALVKDLGIPGHWTEEGIFYEFLSDDGVRLNWWPKTFILSFQGRPDKKKQFVGLFEKHLDIQSHEIDADLQLVIDTWTQLPDSIKIGILTLVHAVLEKKS